MSLVRKEDTLLWTVSISPCSSERMGGISIVFQELAAKK